MRHVGDDDNAAGRRLGAAQQGSGLFSGLLRSLPQSVPDQAGRVDQVAERDHGRSGPVVLAGA
jgi:hypothetical protein